MIYVDETEANQGKLKNTLNFPNYPVSVSTYHLRTIGNTLLVNCVLMCFIISCFTTGELALCRSVGRSLYYYGMYEFVTRKSRSDCAMDCVCIRQLLWDFTTIDLSSVQLSIVVQLELYIFFMFRSLLWFK